MKLDRLKKKRKTKKKGEGRGGWSSLDALLTS